MINVIPDRVLTEKDLAAWLGVSLPTLQRMRSSGSGPRFVQLSMRRVGYRKGDVEAWLAARTTYRVGQCPAVGGLSAVVIQQAGSSSPDDVRDGQAPGNLEGNRT